MVTLRIFLFGFSLALVSSSASASNETSSLQAKPKRGLSYQIASYGNHGALRSHTIHHDQISAPSDRPTYYTQQHVVSVGSAPSKSIIYGSHPIKQVLVVPEGYETTIQNEILRGNGSPSRPQGNAEQPDVPQGPQNTLVPQGTNQNVIQLPQSPPAQSNHFTDYNEDVLLANTDPFRGAVVDNFRVSESKPVLEATQTQVVYSQYPLGIGQNSYPTGQLTAETVAVPVHHNTYVQHGGFTPITLQNTKQAVPTTGRYVYVNGKLYYNPNLPHNQPSPAHNQLNLPHGQSNVAHHQQNAAHYQQNAGQYQQNAAPHQQNEGNGALNHHNQQNLKLNPSHAHHQVLHNQRVPQPHHTNGDNTHLRMAPHQPQRIPNHQAQVQNFHYQNQHRPVRPHPPPVKEEIVEEEKNLKEEEEEEEDHESYEEEEEDEERPQRYRYDEEDEEDDHSSYQEDEEDNNPRHSKSKPKYLRSESKPFKYSSSDSYKYKEGYSTKSKKPSGRKQPKGHYKSHRYPKKGNGKGKIETIEGTYTQNVPIVHNQKFVREKWYLSKKSE